MKIQGRKNQSVGALGPIGIPTSQPPQPIQEAEPPAPAGDQVNLASTTQVRQLNATIQAMPAVRAEKVEGLRDAIGEGSYYVESDKLARKVVDDILAEALASEMQGKAWH